MKLLRLKITAPKGFRSLQPGFEHYFRTEWQLEEEMKRSHNNTEKPAGERESMLWPFVCAGPNGSGKSNLLEVLAAIFFQLEVLRVRRSFLPEAFFYEAETNPEGLKDGHGIPDAFELEYLIRVPYSNDGIAPGFMFAHVLIAKVSGLSPEIKWLNPPDEVGYDSGDVTLELRDHLLPDYVLGYSSGENEILSLPFFKMRFIQYDEYWNALKIQKGYPGRPDTRMAYLDSSFSQAILLCNLLYEEMLEDKEEQRTRYRRKVQLLCQGTGVQELKEFRIIIKRRIGVSDPVIAEFGETHPALRREEFFIDLCLTHELEDSNESKRIAEKIISRLKRCATLHYTDEATDTLYLDYYVDSETRKAFSRNFEFADNRSPVALFQAFQVLLLLNLYSASSGLKASLYRSDSDYVNETVPTLASDERIMRFKFVKFAKEGVEKPVMLKSLSDGEHQLLHSLGLCLLFKNTNSLFLLDEPETHFNPEWRSSFISRLRECFADAKDTHEMLITTHSPFLISDSKPDRVLEFEKKDGTVHVKPPEYNTFGASINQITMSTFHKHETIGGVANQKIEDLRRQFENGEDKDAILKQLNELLGDSIEKIMLIKTILDRDREKS